MGKKWVQDDLISIRERAYRYLKNLILEGVYKAGDRLIERELADNLQISRTPIREALFRLESQGFVNTVPRRGVVVANFSVEQVIEVFTILSSLEVLAAKLAAQKMDEGTALEFSKIIRELKNLEGKTPEEISQLHLDTSLLLYKAAKSPKLFEILTGLEDYIRIFANMGYETPGRREESMKEHLDIMIAVRNKEDEMAEFLTRIHIENSKKAFINYINQNKEEGK